MLTPQSCGYSILLADAHLMPQSAELAGGAGFTYEGYVAAYYLAAMLDEAHAPGIEDRTVFQVAVQRRTMGEQLDDVIVDFADRFGEMARLSLQVKQTLKISSTSSNTDFRTIVRDCRETRAKHDFRSGTDRYGAAVGTVNADMLRGLQELGEIARASLDSDDFRGRFRPGGNAPERARAVLRHVTALLDETCSGPCPPEQVHDFLAHFVVLRYDFLHSGAGAPQEAINRIRESLDPSSAGEAALVWSRLVEWSRVGAGRSERFDRLSLVRRLSPVVRLRGAPSLRADLERLKVLASSYSQAVQDDIGGERLGRNGLDAKLDAELALGRLVQVVGPPGSGKSVLLRRAVERALGRGPTLFLKADQLEARSWNGFAISQGISGASLIKLLVEIGATGTPVLFVDAIDRVGIEQQPIILDLVRTILGSGQLDNWNIVLTLRDTGMEPLRNWLHELLEAVTVRSVEVGPLTDEEAVTLAVAKPHLSSLLFGPPDVRSIVRRPFFAKILDQGLTSDPGGPAFEPRSEIDLVEHWWRRGGYNASGQAAIERQRTIVALARERARNMSLPIRYSRLPSLDLVDELIVDGVLQEVRPGHSARFAHDIFFEWSFTCALVDRDAEWLEEVRAAGEPPAVGRAVELLSQSAYAEGNTWSMSLEATQAVDLRSQWARAWLVGLFGSPAFEGNESRFEAVAFAGNHEMLHKVLVWFQAEKTTPNTSLLSAEHIKQDERQRFADLLGWPSDFTAWRRLITFLLDRVGAIPVRLYPEIVSVLEVWQNALSDHKNSVSSRLLSQVAGWLSELDAIRLAESPQGSPNRWGALPDYGDFRGSLVRMILRAATAEPEHATQFLLRATSDRANAREIEFSAILMFSPTLARTHPALLAELAFARLRGELPDERVLRERAEAEAQARRRREILDKPEAERAHLDRLMLPSIGRISQGFSHHDWQELSIDRTFEPFSPPSPLREPFHSLFRSAPNEALRLLRQLSNHAISAWRQLHRLDHDRRSTPIALEIEFPWGKRTFWGNSREYLWSRGTWAPDPIACGFLALEDWCLEQMAGGVDADGVIRLIVEGHDCVAALGTAVAVALEIEAFSDAILPIVCSQRLGWADHDRFAHDLSSSSASLIGFSKAADRPHVEALKAINGRVIRRKQLRWLAQRYVALGGTTFSARARQAISSFSDELPYLYEESRADPELEQQLFAKALEYAEAADPANYKVYRAAESSQDLVIVHESPTAARPDSVTRAGQTRQSLEEWNTWHWVSRTFETGEIDESLALSDAISFASRIDAVPLFEEAGKDDDEGLGMRRGCVAGVAAVALAHREGLSEEQLEWARSVLRRAYEAPEMVDRFRIPQSVIPWHEAIAVARGLAADVRVGTGDSHDASRLLNLVGHPLEVVSLAAFDECCRMWPTDPRLAWSAIHVAFALCRIQSGPGRGWSDAVHDPDDVRVIITRADTARLAEMEWEPMPQLPPAWTRVDASLRGGRSPRFRSRRRPAGQDLEGPEDAWAEPDVSWYGVYAAKLLPSLPLEGLLGSSARNAFLDFVAGLLDYTNCRNAPPWAGLNGRDHADTRLYEWADAFSRALSRLAGLISLAEFQPRFLDPLLALQDEGCWRMLDPFARSFVCRHVLDASELPEDAVRLLGLCLDRLLSSRVFDPASHRAGELFGFDLPGLVETLMFVPVEHASAAARFANGDWSEIRRVLPLVDRLVRAAGWSAEVMNRFLTLCERAKSDYPADAFADQILAIIYDAERPLRRWHGTFLPARIAELVQYFAARHAPLQPSLGRSLLRILDALVDLGDRRSAALQRSEAFRDIRIGG
jgi:hypothetical protein